MEATCESIGSRQLMSMVPVSQEMLDDHPVAEKSPPPHRQTALGVCASCGIYAWKDHKPLDDVLDLARMETLHEVVGTVLLWGKVIVHQNGYRAQYAKVNQLFRMWDRPLEPIAEKLAEFYGCKLVEPPKGLVPPYSELRVDAEVLERQSRTTLPDVVVLELIRRANSMGLNGQRVTKLLSQNSAIDDQTIFRLISSEGDPPRPEIG